MWIAANFLPCHRPWMILPLASQYLAEVCSRSCIEQKVLSDGAARALCNYFWPGNIRELRNVLERAAVLSEGMTIEPADLPAAIQVLAGPSHVRAESCWEPPTLVDKDATQPLHDRQPRSDRPGLQQWHGELGPPLAPLSGVPISMSLQARSVVML
jgi:DNA-binding NtrC family response regulator